MNTTQSSCASGLGMDACLPGDESSSFQEKPSYGSNDGSWHIKICKRPTFLSKIPLKSRESSSGSTSFDMFVDDVKGLIAPELNELADTSLQKKKIAHARYNPAEPRSALSIFALKSIELDNTIHLVWLFAAILMLMYYVVISTASALAWNDLLDIEKTYYEPGGAGSFSVQLDDHIKIGSYSFNQFRVLGAMYFCWLILRAAPHKRGDAALDERIDICRYDVCHIYHAFMITIVFWLVYAPMRFMISGLHLALDPFIGFMVGFAASVFLYQSLMVMATSPLIIYPTVLISKGIFQIMFDFFYLSMIDQGRKAIEASYVNSPNSDYVGWYYDSFFSDLKQDLVKIPEFIEGMIDPGLSMECITMIPHSLSYLVHFYDPDHREVPDLEQHLAKDTLPHLIDPEGSRYFPVMPVVMLSSNVGSQGAHYLSRFVRPDIRSFCIWRAHCTALAFLSMLLMIVYVTFRRLLNTNLQQRLNISNVDPENGGDTVPKKIERSRHMSFSMRGQNAPRLGSPFSAASARSLKGTLPPAEISSVVERDSGDVSLLPEASFSRLDSDSSSRIPTRVMFYESSMGTASHDAMLLPRKLKPINSPSKDSPRELGVRFGSLSNTHLALPSTSVDLTQQDVRHHDEYSLYSATLNSSMEGSEDESDRKVSPHQGAIQSSGIFLPSDLPDRSSTHSGESLATYIMSVPSPSNRSIVAHLGSHGGIASPRPIGPRYYFDANDPSQSNPLPSTILLEIPKENNSSISGTFSGEPMMEEVRSAAWEDGGYKGGGATGYLGVSLPPIENVQQRSRRWRKLSFASRLGPLVIVEFGLATFYPTVYPFKFLHYTRTRDFKSGHGIFGDELKSKVVDICGGQNYNKFVESSTTVLSTSVFFVIGIMLYFTTNSGPTHQIFQSSGKSLWVASMTLTLMLFLFCYHLNHVYDMGYLTIAKGHDPFMEYGTGSLLGHPMFDEDNLSATVQNELHFGRLISTAGVAILLSLFTLRGYLHGQIQEIIFCKTDRSIRPAVGAKILLFKPSLWLHTVKQRTMVAIYILMVEFSHLLGVMTYLIMLISNNPSSTWSGSNSDT